MVYACTQWHPAGAMSGSQTLAIEIMHTFPGCEIGLLLSNTTT